MGDKLNSDRWALIVPLAIVVFLIIVLAAAYAMKDEPSSAPIRNDRWNAPVQEKRRLQYP